MATSMEKKNEKKSIYANDEFEKYLKRQRIRTTCNGKEVAPFSWYQKSFGLA